MADVLDRVVDEVALVVDAVQGIGGVGASSEEQNPEQTCTTQRSDNSRRCGRMRLTQPPKLDCDPGRKGTSQEVECDP